MRFLKFIILIITFTFLEIGDLCSQPGPPGGGGGGTPPCWPPSNCTPINNELWIMVLAGLIVGIYFLRKNKLSNTSV